MEDALAATHAGDASAIQAPPAPARPQTGVA